MTPPASPSPPSSLPAALERHHRALAVASLVGVAAYYKHCWPRFEDFVLAIDHNRNFMQDFRGHYYPIARQILDHPTPVYGYYYSAFFALLLAPVGALPLRAAIVVWGAGQAVFAAALCVACARIARLSRAGAVLFALLFATSYPLLSNLKWGQVSVPLTLCVVGAWGAARRGRSGVAGALLGFAAAIKFYPAWFVVYFALRRDLRACASFALTALGCYAAVPMAALGPGAWIAFERSVRDGFAHSRWVMHAENSQYAAHVVMRWLKLTTGDDHERWLRALTAASALVALGCAAMTARLVRRGDDALALVPLFLALPFLLNTSWPHYLVYLPLCQAVLLARGATAKPRSLRDRLPPLLAALSIALSSVGYFNVFPEWEFYNALGMPFLANASLLVAVAMVAATPPREATAP